MPTASRLASAGSPSIARSITSNTALAHTPLAWVPRCNDRFSSAAVRACTARNPRTISVISASSSAGFRSTLSFPGRPWCKSRGIRRALHPGGRRCACFSPDPLVAVKPGRCTNDRQEPIRIGFSRFGAVIELRAASLPAARFRLRCTTDSQKIEPRQRPHPYCRTERGRRIVLGWSEKTKDGG